MATPNEPSLRELLHRRAAESPERLAFVVDGRSQLTYSTWEHRAGALASGLRRHGIGEGDRVVLRFDASAWCDFAVAYAGAHLVGAIGIPVPAPVSPIQLTRIVADCGASIIISGPVTVAELEADATGGSLASGGPRRGPVEIAYRSRRLERPHATPRTAAEILAGMEPLLTDGADPVLGALLHCFAVGTDGARDALWLPLVGYVGPVVNLPAFDPERFCAVTAERRARCWSLAPVVAGWLLDSGAADRHDITSVTRIVLHGGRASASLVGRLADQFPGASVNTRGPLPPPEVPVAESGGSAPLFSPGTGGAGPVAASQVGMIWHEQFAPGSQNLPPLVRRYEGPLDVEAFGRALSEIVRRHEPLRTTFALQDGRPVQVVSAFEPLPFPLTDLSHLGPPEREDEVARVLAEAGRPFDLVAGPLFEAALLRLGPEEHLAVIRVHHSVYDDWSVSVFRRELSALYTAYTEGRSADLSDLPLPFTAFSLGQRRRLAGPVGVQQLSWWKEQLAGAPLCVELPIGDPDRPPGSPQPSARPVSLALAPELHAQLRALAGRQRVTPFMTVLAGFQVLLRHWTGHSELLLASVVANRNRTELENMIGCFTKKILLRHSLTGDPTFAEVLARTRPMLLGALSHQDLPFETVLQEALGAPAAAHGLVPYPMVMVQGVTPQTDDVVVPGISTTGYDTAATARRAHFIAGDEDAPPGGSPWGAGLYGGTFLILSVTETAAGLSLTARGAFHRPAVDQLLSEFRDLLTELVDHPFQPLSNVVVASRPEPAARAVELRGFRIDTAAMEGVLRRCPGVAGVRVAVEEQAPGDRRIVAHVEPDAEGGPTLDQLRVALWTELPGSAWPAVMVMGEVVDESTPDGPEGRFLAAMWAEVLRVDDVAVDRNYWQDFSFLEVVARAREAGVGLSDDQVARNRTIATLGIDMAAARLRG